MAMLSEDDVDLRNLSDEELELAWDLWFDLAQATNESDPPYTHGVFQLARARPAVGDSPLIGADAARSERVDARPVPRGTARRR